MATVRIQLRRGTADQWYDANPILAAGEVGLETDTNTFKFGDGATNWNDLSYALSDTVDDYIPLTEKGEALGVATLDSDGYVPAAQLPPLAKITVNAVADQSARLALTAEPGDIAIQSDNGTTYVLENEPASTNGNWREISATAAISAAVSAHESDTTNVHGIADTSLLATTAYADQAEADAISAAALDATTKANLAQSAAEATAAADATSKANAAQSAAQSAAEATAAAALSSHASDTTDIHGIADTAQLVTLDGTQTLTNKTLTSPTLSGTPTAPTADPGQNNTQIATTQFVTSAIADLVSSAPAALNTLDELAAALGDDANFASTVTNSLALKAPLASPSFTGTASFENATGITKSMVGLENVDNTSDADKPLSDAALNAISTINTNIDQKAPHTSPIFTGTVVLPSTTTIGDVSNVEIAHLDGVTSSIQTQIDSKAPLESPTFTGTVSGIDKTMVGLGNVDNTTDVNKPISTATQDALDLKAPIESPTFTGTVSGVTASMVGLGNVNNTSDSNKPISTATQTALNLKADLDSPTFTGTVILPDATITSGMIANETIVTADLATDSVSTVKIQDGAVTTAKIPDGAITTAKVGDSSITNIKLADDAVDTAEIKDSAVVTSKIADSAVTSAKIANGTIVNEDISATAAIAQSKIANLTTDLAAKALDADLDSHTGATTSVHGISNTANLVYTDDSRLSDTRTPTDNTVSTAKIQDSAVTTAKINDGAITSAKIADGAIVNADINASAAIDWTKLAVSSTVSSTELGYLDGVTSAIQTQLDAKALDADLDAHTGASTSVHGISDTAQLAYLNAANQTFTGNMEVDGNMTVDGNLTVNGTTFSASATSIVIEDNMVQLAHENAANSVDLGLVVAYNDGTAKHSGIVRDVSADKWKLFKGVTSEPSTTVDFTQGSLDDLEVAGLTASSLTVGSVSNTEIGYLDGVTSAIQTQIDTKAPTASPTFTGTVVLPSTTSVGSVSSTEIGYLDGVTSAIQTQIDTKAPTASPTFTGTVTVAASGIAYTDGTQTKEGVPSRTYIYGAANSNAITADATLSTLAYRDSLIEVNSSNAVTLTIPPNSTTAFPIGTSWDIVRMGSGAVTIAAGSGVTLNYTPGNKLRAQYSSGTLFKRGTDSWLLIGDLTA